MQPSLATGPIVATDTPPEAVRFYRQFAQHSPHQWWRVATAKDAPTLAVPRGDLGRYPFFKPNHAESWQVIVVDVDPREDLGETQADTLEKITAPDIPRPHWIIETDKGAQAGWLIEDVSTRPDASEKAKAYARAVALRLRRAVGGDLAVDPLTADRVRNPFYGPLIPEGRLHASPMAPYTLRELHWTLYAAGLWPKRLAGEQSMQQGREYNGVNDEVNSRAWLTVRRELEAGTRSSWTEEQVLDLVATINIEAAENQGKPPQTERELQYIAASITRHQHRPGSRRPSKRSGASSDVQAERGAKGGGAGTLAQKRQRQERAAQGTAVRSAAKAMRDEQIRLMRWQEGKTNAEIAAELNVSIRTVKRAVSGGAISGATKVVPAVRPLLELPTVRRATPSSPRPRLQNECADFADDDATRYTGAYLDDPPPDGLGNLTGY